MRPRTITLWALAAALACSDSSGPGVRYSMSILAGDAQTDTVGKTLATPYAVRVLDSAGAAASGVIVSWKVTAGGGTISASSTTDGTGLATAVRTLGTIAGPATAQASAGSAAVTFAATALAGPPVKLSKGAGDQQTGAPGLPLPVPFAALVQDQYDNPVESVTVAWSVAAGGGSPSAAASATARP